MNINNLGISTGRKNKSHWFTSRVNETFRKIAEGDFSISENSTNLVSNTSKTLTDSISKDTLKKDLLKKYNNNLITRKKIEEKMENLMSKNDIRLTEKQLNYLKDKYDVENMTSNEFENLIRELKEMEIISSEFASNAIARPIPPGGFVMYGYDRHDTAFDFTSPNNYLLNFKKENARIDVALAALNKGESSFNCSFEEILKYFSTQKSINNRLISILEMIKKD